MGQSALDVARARLNGDRGVHRPELPDWAGDLDHRTGRPIDESTFWKDTDTPREEPNPLDEVFSDDEAVAAVGTRGREPGEEGKASVRAMAHLAGGLGGATAGWSSGDPDDPWDRARRAALFGAAGFAAPALVGRGGGGAVARGTFQATARTAGNAAGAQPLARGVLHARPITEPMRGIETFIRHFPDDVRNGIRARIEVNGGFVEQRRGSIPQAETERLAHTLAVDVSQRLPPGTALNAEGIRAYATAAASIQAKVDTLAAKVARGEATEAETLALAAAQSEHTIVLGSLMGARAETGRALASFNMYAKVLDTGDINLVRAALDGGARTQAQRIAREVATLPADPVARLRYLQAQAREPMTVGDVASSVFYANILSGVKTHERNFLGNAFNALSNLAVHPVAAGLDVARAAVTRQPRACTVPSQ